MKSLQAQAKHSHFLADSCLLYNEIAKGVFIEQNMKDFISQGVYISAMYMLTGEERGDIVIPKKNFDPKTGGLGAWEVLARYEYVDSDKAHGSEPVIVKENVLGNTIQAFTLGLNWYLNKNVRLKFNYVFYDFDKKENLKNPDIGDRSNQFLTRFQLVF